MGHESLDDVTGARDFLEYDICLVISTYSVATPSFNPRPISMTLVWSIHSEYQHPAVWLRSVSITQLWYSSTRHRFMLYYIHKNADRYATRIDQIIKRKLITLGSTRRKDNSELCQRASPRYLGFLCKHNSKRLVIHHEAFLVTTPLKIFVNPVLPLL